MATVDAQVSANGDDWTWFEASSVFSAAAGALAFGYVSVAQGPVNSGIRVVLNVPQGATINADTYLRFRSLETRTETTVNLIVSAVDADDPAAPTTYSGAETATRTTATVAINNVPTWTLGADHDLIGLSTVVKEIVDRPGWVSGNHIILYVEDNGSSAVDNTQRRAVSHNTTPATAPILHVDYDLPPQTVNVPLLTNTSVLYAPTLTGGAVTVAVPFLTNTSVIYAMALAGPTEVMLAPFVAGNGKRVDGFTGGGSKTLTAFTAGNGKRAEES